MLQIWCVVNKWCVEFLHLRSFVILDFLAGYPDSLIYSKALGGFYGETLKDES